MIIYHIFLKDKHKIELNTGSKFNKKNEKNLNDKEKIVKEFTQFDFF